MAREFARWFYDSSEWRKCRAAFISHRISVDGGMCEICHERLGYIVHHKKKLTPININNPDVSLSFSNLQYVCLDCHNREHGKKGKTEMRCAFTEDGDVIPVPPLKRNKNCAGATDSLTLNFTDEVSREGCGIKEKEGD